MIAFVAWHVKDGFLETNTRDLEDWTCEPKAHELVGFDAEDIADLYYCANRRFLVIYVGF